jgi:hypothetical protein
MGAPRIEPKISHERLARVTVVPLDLAFLLAADAASPLLRPPAQIQDLRPWICPAPPPPNFKSGPLVVRGRRVDGAAKPLNWSESRLSVFQSGRVYLGYRSGTFLRCMDRILNRTKRPRTPNLTYWAMHRPAWPKEPLAGVH